MKHLIRNISLAGEDRSADVLIDGEFISQIGHAGSIMPDASWTVTEGRGKLLFPGLIDDQVHFREPGLTHKGDIATESAAAVAGGITSFMEMPNTVPQTLTQELLEEKYSRAAAVSSANYSFFMGASNTNLDEVLKTDPENVCGIKVFMGSSTGNMLVDNREVLEQLFSQTPMLVAVHCEDEATVKKNLADFVARYGEDIPVSAHPLIRSAEACYKSSSMAVELAVKHDTRLHILHISTARELELFNGTKPLSGKKITAEACIHHLWFSDADYKDKGVAIKWNPAVKSAADREAIRQAVNDDRIDVIATDHAPHLREEKWAPYLKSASGGPLVQHALPAMLELHRQGVFSLKTIVEKMCHNPAILFGIEKRGFIREGFYADLVIVDPDARWEVSSSNTLYKCRWSPFEGEQFSSRVVMTLINGTVAYDEQGVNPRVRGKRLKFNRVKP